MQLEVHSQIRAEPGEACTSGLVPAGPSGVELFRAELSRFSEQNPTGARIRLSVDHRSSFLHGCAPGAEHLHLIVIRDGGAIVGTASLARYRGFVRGSPSSVGLLGNLRIARDASASRGAIFLRGLRAVSAIVEGEFTEVPLLALVLSPAVVRMFRDVRTKTLLTRDLGQYHSCMIRAESLCSTGRVPAGRALSVRGVRVGEIPRLIRFLDTVGAAREFFPQIAPTDLLPAGSNGPESTARYPGLSIADMLVAESKGEIVGSIGIWNQSAMRAWHVAGYSPFIGFFRPIYSAVAPLFGRIPLPPVGAELSYRMGTCFAVADGRREIADALIRAARARLAADPERPSLVVGLHERDPILPAIRALSGHTFSGTLFAMTPQRDIRCRVSSMPLAESGWQLSPPWSSSDVPYIDVGMV